MRLKIKNNNVTQQVKPFDKSVEFSSCLTLTGFNGKVVDDIKQNLTLDNPAYATVKRYSKYATTSVPPYLFFYEQVKDRLKIPCGFPLDVFYNFSSINITDTRCCKRLAEWGNYKFNLSLREEQQATFYRWQLSNRTIMNNGVIQLKTGKGKSILALFIAKHLSMKTLIVVHKNDLVNVWKEDIKKVFGDKMKVGLIKAKSFDYSNLITIATVQTLAKIIDAKKGKELIDMFGLVVLDELHHVGAPTFNMVSKFNSRYKIGLTATPERSDGLEKLMNMFFGRTVYSDKEEKTGDDNILPVDVYPITAGVCYNPIYRIINTEKGVRYKSDGSSERDFSLTDSLSCDEIRYSSIPNDVRPDINFFSIDSVVIPRMYEEIKNKVMLEYQQGHSCVAFFSQKEFCRYFEEYLRKFDKNIQCGIYYGDNSNAENEAVIKKASETRQFITITTYSKSTEGTNCPQWECAFLCSSIVNSKNIEQVCGRVRRIAPNKLKTAKVYDFVYKYVILLSRHYYERYRRYKLLKFTVKEQSSVINKGKVYSRGYRL